MKKRTSKQAKKKVVTGKVSKTCKSCEYQLNELCARMPPVSIVINDQIISGLPDHLKSKVCGEYKPRLSLTKG